MAPKSTTARSAKAPTADELSALLGNNTGAGAAEPPVVAKTQPEGMPEYVRIVLEENDNIPRIGQFFGINGRGYMLKPGVEAMVPTGIIDILENAVEDRPVVDPETNKITGYTKRYRYPFRKIAA